MAIIKPGIMKYFFIMFVMVLGISLCFSATAQVQYNANANHAPRNLEAKSLVILYINAISKNQLEEHIKANSTDYLSISTAEDEYDNMAKKEFGSYVNPFNNQLRIVPTDDIKYTKIQIVKRGTGITVVKKRINKGNNLIDMSNIEAGRYILIMTNDERSIYSEEITII